jgi:hypothetical protein
MQMYDDIIEALIEKADKLDWMAETGSSESRSEELRNKARGVRLALSVVYQSQAGKLHG